MGELRIADLLPVQAHRWEDLVLFAWDVTSNGRGSLGVTDDPSIATGHLSRALLDAPLTAAVHGALRHVHADLQAAHPRYVYGRVLIRFCRDGTTGEIKFAIGE